MGSDRCQDPAADSLEPGLYLSGDWSLAFFAGLAVGVVVGEMIAWLIVRVGG